MSDRGDIEYWLFPVEPYEGESLSHFLGRFRRRNYLYPSAWGDLAGIGGIVARWEKFYLNPFPTDREFQVLAEVIGVDRNRLRAMLPPRGISMKCEPIRMCGACYEEVPCHRTEHLWGVITNGLQWRLLRDCSLMTRLSYIEFDLEQILQNENYAEFGLFYRLFHRTRLPEGMDDCDKCLLEFYHQQTLQQGGGGQNALVVTYAAAGSPHDRYFYERQQQMVAGVVVPPRLELANQDLVKSHVYSLWLSYTGVNLGNSMNEILDLEQDYPYPLKNDIKAQLKLNKEALQECFEDLDKVLSDSFCQTDLQKVSWYSQDWLKQTLSHAFHAFDRVCDRWRDLYYDADNQLTSARENIDRHSKGNSTKEERKEAEALEKEAKRQKDLLVGQSQGNNKSQFDFYPYRYFASEGFLPGFNFPRLPIRAYIRAGDKGEFIARHRTIAIRELAPTNVLYYEGNKYQINKTRIPVKGVVYNQIAICHYCGYYHNAEDYHRNTCINCGQKLSQDDKGNPAKLTQVLEMDNAIARRTNRITCDEEERLKYGYDLVTHFQYAPRKQRTAKVLSDDGTELLRLSYGETADILRINRGLTKSKEIGFKLDTASGDWVSLDNYQPQGEVDTSVHLMVKDTSNILIIEPKAFPEQKTESFIVTLQYALERAIQAQYKLENNELSSERIGKGKHILFWESSEGGAGVLSQILEDSASMQKIAQQALDICHFLEPKNSCA